MRQSILRTACTAFLLFTASVQAGTLEEGRAAFGRQDYSKALELLLPLAEKGDAQSQVYLGAMYEGGLGVSRDSAMAVAWYNKAAEQGYSSAQSTLAFMYELGEGGVTQDHAIAAKWFRKMAAQDDVTGQRHLALKYFEGKGVAQDYREAYKWAFLAVERENCRCSPHAVQLRDLIAEHLTQEDIATAQRLAREWESNHSKH